MIDHAEADGIPTLTHDNDPRITGVGRWLRKYRLDELPQLWNILRGEMSIVGPRPERPYFVEQIMAEAPYYCLLYKVRPGLTSWGPIRVGYTDTMEKMIERLNCDVVYVENMSLLLDLKIIFFTTSVILHGKGK
jgi:lipopolysaccharide/colanic/teichoic acid biosynthesis glycosyltransferase